MYSLLKIYQTKIPSLYKGFNITIQLNFNTLPSSSSVADGQSQQITMSQTGHVYLYIGNVLNEWKACNDPMHCYNVKIVNALALYKAHGL